MQGDVCYLRSFFGCGSADEVIGIRAVRAIRIGGATPASGKVEFHGKRSASANAPEVSDRNEALQVVDCRENETGSWMFVSPFC